MESNTQHTRRSVVTKTAIGVGAAWIAPTILSSAASAQGSGCTPSILDWGTFPEDTLFTSTTINGITITVTITAVVSPTTTLLASNGTPQSGTFGGQSLPWVEYNMVPDALNVGQTVTFDFTGGTVENLAFSFLDIDNAAGAWSDRLVINTAGFGFNIPGTSSVLGSGTTGDPFLNSGTDNVTNASVAGNLDITHAGPITQFEFFYRNDTVTGGGNQRIGLTNFSFDACP